MSVAKTVLSLCIVVCGLGFATSLRTHAQSLSFSTLAGAGPGSTDASGPDARFFYPKGLAMDSATNVYVADTENHTIRKITPNGAVTTLAGLAGMSGSSDGLAGVARFNEPSGIVIDSAGNLYVADTGNNTIRKISSAGMVTTLAGRPGSYGSADGTNSNVRFNQPFHLALDSSTNIYVADCGNHTIRKLTRSGTNWVASTLAGQPGFAGSADGPGSLAQFNHPWGIAVDGNGNIYVADADNFTIRKISPSGGVSTLAGLAGSPGNLNGPAGVARFIYPTAVSVDGSGNVFVADAGNSTIRKVFPSGTVAPVGGRPGINANTDGLFVVSCFNHPCGLALDGGGNLYVADSGNNTVRKITPSRVVSTLAGLAVGSSGAVDGKRSVARFCGVQGTALDAVGNVYVTDTGNNTVRKITPLGIVSKVAGLAGSSGTNDDVSSNARFFRPEGLGLDNAGNLYVADSGNHTVRKITASGTVSTFAGLPGTPGTNDGTGTNARFCNPSGIAVDANNNIFVAEYGNNVIRKITPTGVVTTLAGLAGAVGADDGFGTNARFALPRSIAADPFGNLYVADTGNHTIRKITSNGQVTTVAGQAGTAGSNDGLGISAQFFSPEGVAADNAGNVYVADSLNATIRMIAPDGTVSTLAGQTGSLGCADDIGRKVQFQHPKGIAVDSGGAVYVADAFNNTVRKGVPYSGPVLAGRLQNQTTLGGGNIIFSVNVTGQPPLSYQWRKDGVNIAGATGATLTIFNTAFSDAGDYDVVISNPYGAIVSGAATLFVIVPPNDLFINATALSDNDTSITSANVGASIEPGEPFHANYPGGASVWWKWTASAPESVRLDTFGSTFPTLLAVYTGNSVSNLTPVASNYGFYSWYSLLFFDAVAGQTYYFAVDGVYGATGLIQLDFKVNTPVPPSVIEQPKGLVDMPGAIVMFGALTEGSNPINYQWRRNGSAIPGATNNMLALYYITDADAAVYDMVVSNAYGTAISQGATLALRPGYTFTTLAGNPNGGSTDATGTNAQFDFPVGVATDSSSNSYVADNSNSTIRKINPAGAVTTLAGQAGVTGSNDGTNGTAQFLFPTGLAVDNATNLYVADTYNNAIRKVTPAGVATTFAGAGGSSPGSLDGIGTNASFFLPSGVATDKAGNIYVAEAGSSLIRKITPVGSVTTIAGSPGNYGSADGIGTNALFLSPLGIAIDNWTNIFVADTYNHTIRKITPDGTVTTLAGQAGGPGCLDGAGDFARFAHPSALAVDAAGNLLVADTDNNAIRMVTPAGVVSTVAGISTASSFADGTGNGAAFYHPDGIAIDKAGTLYVSDGYNFTVRIGHAFVPPVLRFSRAPNAIVLTWPVTTPGFAAETSTGLRNAPWTPLTGGVTSDGANFVVTNAISSAPVFYRLRLQP